MQSSSGARYKEYHILRIESLSFKMTSELAAQSASTLSMGALQTIDIVRPEDQDTRDRSATNPEVGACTKHRHLRYN